MLEAAARAWFDGRDVRLLSGASSRQARATALSSRVVRVVGFRPCMFVGCWRFIFNTILTFFVGCGLSEQQWRAEAEPECPNEQMTSLPVLVRRAGTHDGHFLFRVRVCEAGEYIYIYIGFLCRPIGMYMSTVGLHVFLSCTSYVVAST